MRRLGSRTDWLNGAGIVLAVILASITATWIQVVVKPVAKATVSVRAPDVGASEVVDARGHAVPVRRYTRIVSLNTVADQILLHLVEPQYLLSVTGWSLDEHPEGWRFGDRPRVADSNELESVISQRPELVIVSNFADEAYMSRLREAGIAVFDLGESLGISTTRVAIQTLGALLDRPERARRLRRAYDRDIVALTSALDGKPRRRGLYLTVYQDNIMGGTTGTSYADLLRLGGVIDLAAQTGFTQWPTYSPEQLIAMDPPLIITQPGMGQTLCSKTQLQDLLACSPAGRIIELAEAYHSDPGLGLIEAAQDLQDALHPTPTPKD